MPAVGRPGEGSYDFADVEPYLLGNRLDISVYCACNVIESNSHRLKKRREIAFRSKTIRNFLAHVCFANPASDIDDLADSGSKVGGKSVLL